MFCQRMCGRKAKPGRRLCQECQDRTRLREAQQYDHRVVKPAGAASMTGGRGEGGDEAPDHHPSHRESAAVQVSACVQIPGDLGCMARLAEECFRFADDGG